MKLWKLDTLAESGRTGPRVLFSTPEARVVVIDLAPAEELGEHTVRERAVLQIVKGSLQVSAGDGEVTCDEGTLVMFEPSERHTIRAVGPVRLLLTLAPWPAPDHYDPAEQEDPHELPAHATVPESRR